MKKNIVSFLAIIAIFILSCSDNSTDPNESIKKSTMSNSISLSKTTLSTSGIYTWAKTIHEDCSGNLVGFSNSSYSFSYQNYNFSLSFSRSLNNGYWNNNVSVTVNNQYYTTITWSDPWGYIPSTGWVGWSSFNYGTSQISINVYRTYYPDYCGQVDGKTQPDLVQVQVPIFSLDPLTGFNVSPQVHNNLNQAVTVSWNASSDTDVTGYRIYRKLLTESSFSLIQTINSRTTSSWVDNSIPWTYNVPEMTIVSYKMLSFDSVHNITSPETTVKTSSMP